MAGHRARYIYSQIDANVTGKCEHFNLMHEHSYAINGLGREADTIPVGKLISEN